MNRLNYTLFFIRIIVIRIAGRKLLKIQEYFTNNLRLSQASANEKQTIITATVKRII